MHICNGLGHDQPLVHGGVAHIQPSIYAVNRKLILLLYRYNIAFKTERESGISIECKKLSFDRILLSLLFSISATVSVVLLCILISHITSSSPPAYDTSIAELSERMTKFNAPLVTALD
jgi:hypothetical protein